MYDYSIVPSESMQKRLYYFYMPYNQKFQLKKHMTFEENEIAAASPCADEDQKTKEPSELHTIAKPKTSPRMKTAEK